MDGVKVVHDHFYGALLFYKYLFNDRGQKLELMNTVETIRSGDRVLVSNEAFTTLLCERYQLDTLDAYKKAVLFNVNDKYELKRNDK